MVACYLRYEAAHYDCSTEDGISVDMKVMILYPESHRGFLNFLTP